MKQFFRITLTLWFSMAIAFSNSFAVLADGEGDEDTLEVEVHGYHVTLANQSDWKKGENTLVVTLTDSSGSPVSGADVQIMMDSKSEDHAVAEDSHGASEPASAHGAEQGHSGMPETVTNGHELESSHTSSHGEETASSILVIETDEPGVYMAEAHLESSGKQQVSVMFHVNGEMLQADFTVEIPGLLSKTVVLWGFLAINVGLIASAGILKKQSTPVKGQ